MKSLFVPECPTKKTYDEITKKLLEHYEPKINEITERYKLLYNITLLYNKSTSQSVTTL